MILDIPFERGLGQVDYRFSDPEECRFPLFDFLKPLPLVWMYVVYLMMFVGAVGMLLGFLYRFSCLLFFTTYWYVYLLDKTLWNNHSYLYGLCALILLLSDANRSWSIDGIIHPTIRNTHVPLWNYVLLRVQFFIVYFVAGLKKLDPDWLSGYSMESLAHHWVFSPFKYLMSLEQIDLLIVHHGGLLYDLSVGFLLLFDYTRPVAIVLSLFFHGMNSQMFTIGLFPYVMLAALPIFCSTDWPKQVKQKVAQKIGWLSSSLDGTRFSSGCIYPDSDDDDGKHRKQRVGKKHHLMSLFTLTYVALQFFLPYSHFLTPGYNTWTNGLYGYSWDMMVHTWSTQHMRITYVDEETGATGFLKPDAWTRGHIRWSSHADMIKQYASCIQQRLKSHNIQDVALYFDVWRSLNDRFQQRMFDPRVNVINAPWSPWQGTAWLMPLLTELSNWRKKMDEIEKDIYNSNHDVDVVFMADFPGLSVENYIQSDLSNCSIQLLKGEVAIELVNLGKNYTLRENDTLLLPSGQYHTIYTISDTPSCFMYLYINETEHHLQKRLHDLEHGNGDDPSIRELYQQVQEQKHQISVMANLTVWNRLSHFFTEKLKHVVRSVTMTTIAIQSIVMGVNFEVLFNATVGEQESAAF